MNPKNKNLFLSAYWKNLILLTYAVPPEKLLPYCHSGLDLDMIDGKAFVSIVAFDFLDTKVKGWKIPFHINFPELNLRFYVKKGNQRGVVFIREFVPKPAIALVANLIYNENYEACNLSNQTQYVNGNLRIKYKLKRGSKEFSLSMETEGQETFFSPENSLENFFKEQSWGFGLSHSKKLLSYEVNHPRWELYKVKAFEHDFDFAEIFGDDWAFLNSEKVFHSMLAKGSEVSVFEHAEEAN